MAPKTIASLLVCFALVGLAMSHGRLTNPTARTGASDTNHTPCVASTTNAIVANYTAGMTYTLGWHISACHCDSSTNIKWYISYDGTPGNLQQFGPTTLTGTGNGDRTAQVTFPSGKASNRALLQWVWQGNEGGGNEFYYGCADIRVAGSDSQQILCDSNLVKCDSASTMGASALLVLVAIIAALLF